MRSRPGEGARLVAGTAAERARAALERLAGIDELPLVLQFTPRFVPPRRATGELTLDAGSAASGRSAPEGPLHLGPAGTARVRACRSDRAALCADLRRRGRHDPPVAIEVVGLHLSPDGAPPPVLASATGAARRPWRRSGCTFPCPAALSRPRPLARLRDRRAELAPRVRERQLELLFSCCQTARARSRSTRRCVSRAGIAHPGIARDAGARPAGETRWVAAASIRRRAGGSTSKAGGASSSSSDWVGSTISAIRR